MVRFLFIEIYTSVGWVGGSGAAEKNDKNYRTPVFLHGTYLWSKLKPGGRVQYGYNRSGN